MPKEQTIKVKKRCCKDQPRCKKCPVVCKRLEQAGYAERIDLRVYKVAAPKKAIKAARSRKPAKIAA